MNQPVRSASYEMCGARTSSGRPCRASAGAGTNHLGQGRCKHHGGNNPIRHGRYSKIKRDQLRSLIERHEADPDPLNIFPELAAARALFEDFIERYETWRDALLAWHTSYQKGEEEGAKPRQILDISAAHMLLNQITGIVEKIERIRAADAISRPDLYRLVQEFARVVEVRNVIQDPERRLQAIRDDWLSIRLP